MARTVRDQHGVDPKERVALEIRAITVSCRAAIRTGDDAQAVIARGHELLDRVGLQIERMADPDLHALLAAARNEIGPRR